MPHLLVRPRVHSQPPRPLPLVHRRERSNGDAGEGHEGDAVPLMVYAARIGTRDPDALNITRASGGAAGLPFAPTWRILRPALDARRERAELIAIASASPDDPAAGWALDVAAMEWASAWETYCAAYLAEMRLSYRDFRPAWERLVARQRVVLACYCHDEEHCHRRILGAHILPRLGAVWCGEVGATQTNARPPK